MPLAFMPLQCELLSVLLVLVCVFVWYRMYDVRPVGVYAILELVECTGVDNFWPQAVLVVYNPGGEGVTTNSGDCTQLHQAPWVTSGFTGSRAVESVMRVQVNTAMKHLVNRYHVTAPSSVASRRSSPWSPATGRVPLDCGPSGWRRLTQSSPEFNVRSD